MNAITMTNLEKRYATGTHALKDVSFTIPVGSMTALLGANGAGKTTLIGILTGLIKKTGGSAHILGKDIEQSPEAARSLIGVVPQEFNFSIFEKVLDIVVDQGGYYGVSRAIARKRAEKLLQALGLWEKRDAIARTLSGGMKRRLMIARALIHEPKILLLDEPSAGVDVELRRGMWDFIRTMHTKGTTILLTTHYLEEAEQLCDNIVILKQGEVIRTGTVSELLQGLTEQSFFLSVRGGNLASIDNYRIVKKDEASADVTLLPGQTVTDLARDLAEHGITIIDIRPKTNRLEEVFLEVSS